MEDAQYSLLVYMAGVEGSATSNKARGLTSLTKNNTPPAFADNSIVAKKVVTSSNHKARQKSKQSAFAKNSTNSQRFLEEDCEDCVVQQVAPLSCNEKYEAYMQFMNFQPTYFDGAETDNQGNQIL
ncbi:hypothetical protein [Lacinutrix sp. Hel_I_90]|uniref:hypothetical protein n=1 Tax=Lacinutrix sp. Hel_I_90 TaxID=1249999 RepID=UPI0005C8DB36|nr:hypothetical protein [Lacinutrix sp. Hel_I_90]